MTDNELPREDDNRTLFKGLKDITTVGELRQFLQGVPDTIPVVRLTPGYFQINKPGVWAFLGELPLGHMEAPTVCLRIDT